MEPKGSCLSPSRLTISIFLIAIQISTAKSFKPAPITMSVKEPNIWLKGYRKVDALYFASTENEYRFQHQVQNEFVSKNGSDFVISESVNAVDFTCEAIYPVTWIFPFPRQIPTGTSRLISTEEYRISKLFSYASDPLNIRFKTVIRIFCSPFNFLSVNLTCQSTEIKPDIQSSVHIFLKGKDKIEHQEETVKFFATAPKESTSASVLLPCRPATPYLKVSLQQEKVSKVLKNSTLTESKTWDSVTPDQQQSLSFDPKVGFTLHRSIYGGSVFGLYRCSVIDDYGGNEVNELAEESGQFLLINVTMVENDTLNSEANPVLPFHPRSVLHGKATASVTITDRHSIPNLDFMCCTGDVDKPPKLFLNYCTDPTQCGLLKNSILEDIASGKATEYKSILSNRLGVNQVNTPKDCRREPLLSEIGVVVVCQGENVDYVDHLIPCFHPMAGGSVANRTERIRSPNIENVPTRNSKFTFLDGYEPRTVIESDQNVARKAILVVGQRVYEEKDLMKLFISLGRGRLALHAATTYFLNNDMEDSYKESDDKYNANALKPVSHIVEYSRDYYYEGETILFICIGVKDAYANGVYLRLNWKNGTRSLLKEPTSKWDAKSPWRKSLYAFHLSGGARMSNAFANDYRAPVGKAIFATIGMTSVDCWMPKRNSRKWDKISKEIQVVPSLAPMFVEEEEETMYWYVGDAGNIITCTLQQGTPSPSMTVTRNGTVLRTTSVQAAASNQTKPIHPEKGTIQTEVIDKNEDTIAIKIYFAVIEHGDHGSVFQCSATNVNTTTTRTIRISIKEKSGAGTAALVTLSCLTTLVFVFIALGVTYYLKKRHVQNVPAK